MISLSYQNFDVVLLNSDFYVEFSACSQVMSKQARPYLMVLINIHNLDFAVPLRSNCNPRLKPIVYLTENTANDNRGLDFSKAVILNSHSYIKCRTKLSDHLQKTAIIDFKDKITAKLERYVHLYKHKFYDLAAGDYKRDMYFFCAQSSLQYFHKELGLPDATGVINSAELYLVQNNIILPNQVIII